MSSDEEMEIVADPKLPVISDQALETVHNNLSSGKSSTGRLDIAAFSAFLQLFVYLCNETLRQIETFVFTPKKKVYLAEHMLSGERLVVKSIGIRHVNEIVNEMRVLTSKGAAQFKCFVTLRGAFIEEGRFHICTEMLLGTLDKFVQRQILSNAFFAVHIVNQTVEAVKFLKENCGVSHQNLKPGSFAVGADGNIKLHNFESAGPAEGPGTTAYSSPERLVHSRGYDLEKSDVYSLGVTYMELLVGTNPRWNSKDEVVITSPIRLHNPNNEPLISNINTCLSEDAENRPALSAIPKLETTRPEQEIKDDMLAWINEEKEEKIPPCLDIVYYKRVTCEETASLTRAVMNTVHDEEKGKEAAKRLTDHSLSLLSNCQADDAARNDIVETIRNKTLGPEFVSAPSFLNMLMVFCRLVDTCLSELATIQANVLESLMDSRKTRAHISPELQLCITANIWLRDALINIYSFGKDNPPSDQQASPNMVEQLQIIKDALETNQESDKQARELCKNFTDEWNSPDMEVTEDQIDYARRLIMTALLDKKAIPLNTISSSAPTVAREQNQNSNRVFDPEGFVAIKTIHDEGNHTFYLLPQYKYSPEKSLLGVGAYGAVIEVIDTETEKSYAIKKIKCADHKTPQFVLRELIFMKNINHPNIIRSDYVYGVEDRVHGFAVYIIMDKMDCTLEDLIKRYSAQLSHDHVSYIVYQICCGVNHLKHCNIIHRDLKPSNIGVKTNGFVIKLLDFGLARVAVKKDVKMTEGVVTMHYRAPEVFFNKGRYDFQVDVWSIGCIFAELIIRKEPLFPYACKTESELGASQPRVAEKMVERIGNSQQLLLYLARIGKSEILTRTTDEQESKIGRIFAAEYFPKQDRDSSSFKSSGARGADLLSSMLRYDPEERIGVEDAIKHDYFANWRTDKDLNLDFTQVPIISEMDLEKDSYMRSPEEAIEDIKAFVATEMTRSGLLSRT